MSICYSFWLTQVITSSASQVTGYCLLAVDCAINFYNAFVIVKIQRKISPSDENEHKKRELKLKKETLMLTGIELVESLVPLAFLTTFMVVFYGNNSSIIGGVGFSEWQYSEVEDIAIFSMILLLMFAIDLSSWIIN